MKSPPISWRAGCGRAGQSGSTLAASPQATVQVLFLMVPPMSRPPIRTTRTVGERRRWRALRRYRWRTARHSLETAIGWEVVRIRAGTSCRHCEYRAGVPGFKRRGLGSRRSLANVRPKALAGNVFAVQQEFAGSARMRPVSSQCEPCTRRPAPRARGDAASALKLCRSVLRSFPSSVRPPAACQAAISLDAASSPILLNSLVAVCLPGTRLPVLYRSPPACRRTAS